MGPDRPGTPANRRSVSAGSSYHYRGWRGRSPARRPGQCRGAAGGGIACVGSSTTAAQGTFDWIGALAARPQNARFRFLNFGVSGDVSYTALRRLPQVVAAQPGRVLVLIGANDVLGLVFPNARRYYARTQHLPRELSVDWFAGNLRQMVRVLREGATDRVGLTSLAAIGEDPGATAGPQAALNALLAEFNTAIHQIAAEENTVYLPLAERFGELLAESPGQALTRFSFAAFYRDYLIREFVLRQSFDQIAERNGWRFHVDGIHLNTRGGMILADVAQAFLGPRETGQHAQFLVTGKQSHDILAVTKNQPSLYTHPVVPLTATAAASSGTSSGSGTTQPTGTAISSACASAR
jgi:lysophospholipase L1-like esterase